MKIVDSKENKLVFSEKIDESLANAIRRYLNEVPVLAIDDVEIIKNDSALFDEAVAHRLGLIPLETDKVMNDKTEIDLKLSVDKEGFVYSGDLKGKAEVVYKKMPITLLGNEQEIEIVATARMGRGSEHAKYIPGLMFYRNSSKITTDKELLEEIKRVFPKNTVQEKGNKIIIHDDLSEEIADSVEGISEKNGKKAEIEYDDDLIITLESFGQMSTKDMFESSIKQLKKDVEDVSKKIK